MSTKDDTPAAPAIPAESPRKPATSRAKASPAATRAGASWPW